MSLLCNRLRCVVDDGRKSGLRTEGVRVGGGAEVDPRGASRRPLAASTKRRAIVTAKAVMAHAVRMRCVNYDPTANLDAPGQ